MVGFNSDLPTLFVGGSIGLGLTGKIGIGDVTDPHAKLHIKADDGENVDLLLEPGGSSNFAKIKFGEISLNNSPNRIEAKQAGNMDFYTASDYVFRDGNVGIGEHNPDEKLVVDGNIKQSPEFHILSDKIKATGANGLMLQDGTGNGIVVNNGGKVGIGPDATNPSSELEVDGTIFTKHFRLDNSSGSSGPLTGFDGYLLQADEYGNASWADPTSINDGDWETNGDDIYNMNSGNIGIGIVAPESPLHIDSNIGNTNATFFKVSNEGTSIEGGGTTYIGKKAGNGPVFVQQAGNVVFGNGNCPSLSFIQKSHNGEEGLNITTFTNGDGSVDYSSISAENSKLYVLAEEDIIFSTDWDKAESVYFKANGNVGIGLDEPSEKLEVAGNIKAVEMDLSGKLEVYGKIEAGEIEVKDMKKWEDEVFEDSYDLATLSEVEGFIKENGHLPEIPCEADVLENGYNMGEMNAMLLKKIEELTLYVIEQQKEISELKKRQ